MKIYSKNNYRKNASNIIGKPAETEWTNMEVAQEKLVEIETLESYYLEKFYFLLKFYEDVMFEGFLTKEKIKDDWKDKWDPLEEGKGISGFSTGAERIVYAFFNAHTIWTPNSAPVGSDIFFETKDAFVHVDLKTVQTRNIGDFKEDIFVGNNQTSYNGNITIQGKKELRPYDNAALPWIYGNSGNPKPCLTYFITILYEEKNLNILCIAILSMPNGMLERVYKEDVLKAGKNPGKIRFNFSRTPDFRLLQNKKRIMVIYFDKN
ncbi:unnamed protein product, partial [marine sediment metagenome]